ncbi:MAG: hypothetical protein JW913_00685 [Chitinispirillaceae bacterium]|nr:hypothetical protein [Chitinispirillaceae bacterium]
MPSAEGDKKSNHAAAGTRGYTIIETVISLIVLLSIVVPLLTHFYRVNTLAGMRREFVGIWLIEREAAVLRTFPRESLPVKRHILKNEEWTIRTEVSETEPLCYLLTAELRGAMQAKAVFYGRATDDGK